jgi:hypothetical protein
MITLDTEIMRCESWGAMYGFTGNRCRGLLSLCISDAAKQMLLSNAGFIPLLIDGAFPRQSSVQLTAIATFQQHRSYEV